MRPVAAGRQTQGHAVRRVPFFVGG